MGFLKLQSDTNELAIIVGFPSPPFKELAPWVKPNVGNVGAAIFSDFNSVAYVSRG